MPKIRNMSKMNSAAKINCKSHASIARIIPILKKYLYKSIITIKDNMPAQVLKTYFMSMVSSPMSTFMMIILKSVVFPPKNFTAK